MSIILPNLNHSFISPVPVPVPGPGPGPDPDFLVFHTPTFALFRQRCALRTAHGIISTYNWIADYTIIMLVQKIT